VVALSPGLVVLVRFPFSDLSSSKLRPAVILAHAGGVDWVLCQITSSPYGDTAALPLTTSSFANGGLNRDSFVRPGKLFTASAAIITREAGTLTSAIHCELVESPVCRRMFVCLTVRSSGTRRHRTPVISSGLKGRDFVSRSRRRAP
jgi:mRNA interferase MazF